MPRPNLAQDAPPTVIAVGGAEYPVNVDFRVWIGVLRDLRDLVSAPTTAEQLVRNAEIIQGIETAVFGGLIPHPATEVLSAVCAFSKGYPEAPVESSESASVPTYSLEWDLNYIVIAIGNQFGIDLTYRRTEPFHWWEFLLYFRALAGNHYILRLMEIRGYDGKDADLKRQAQRFALPRETTGDDQSMLDAFDALFYNT